MKYERHSRYFWLNKAAHRAAFKMTEKELQAEGDKSENPDL